jgi:hypothetical protein
VNYLPDEARARYVQEKMAMVELMGEKDDTSRLSELIALAEAGLHVAPAPFPSTTFVPMMRWISNVYRTGVRWPL